MRRDLRIEGHSRSPVARWENEGDEIRAESTFAREHPVCRLSNLRARRKKAGEREMSDERVPRNLINLDLEFGMLKQSRLFVRFLRKLAGSYVGLFAHEK